ncbi:response regulator transcription factor [Synechococcus sp. R55.8]|uniref:response regulator transcription factor n=1 Tax=Synechococcus sp. R55.8 TaxID=2964501 RepID=UPI0039C2310A
MQPLHILLAEGNPHLRSLLCWHLQQAGHQVWEAETLRQAKTLLQQQPIHLLILDAELSNRGGLQLCRWAHRQYDLLILLLSHRGSEADIIAGLEAGADDYLTKPFSMQLLDAHLLALARRRQRHIPPTFLQYGDLKIDLVQRRVALAGEGIDLTPQEFSLLMVLVQADGDPVSRLELLERAWPDSTDNPRTVDTHILSLRKKLERDPRQPSLIHTVRNVGYCFGLNPPLLQEQKTLSAAAGDSGSGPQRQRRGVAASGEAPANQSIKSR